MSEPDMPRDEAAMLRDMLAIADRLAASEDALMAGQYAHLRARVAALVELRSFADGAEAA
ncbi:hypothetical protein [Sphingomonas hengshuiensis]|uniref:Uncharacterized protein n=1 Tax=Sphingomonas hengshuiensis TaxID=1609977 RepID=A0A7U4J6N6_9SPHN|nr:hypothetical protein [Sphingomonas hengshuiensis]AJP71228.1 hypothetical protein TS85_04535 [Sphingomonas hengshuiensis]